MALAPLADWDNFYGVAAVCMVLWFGGIHDAWDVAVWMTLPQHDAPEGKDSAPEKKSG